ncbi:MAG TPA: hypothetical protein VHZ03_44330 [Trebonia sp.]|jgi:hypothetical protein|nr:hypothetical protein [Trebonia sp.]
MIDSGQITHRPGWNEEVLGQFAMAEYLPARLCAQMTWNVIRAPALEEFEFSTGFRWSRRFPATLRTPTSALRTLATKTPLAAVTLLSAQPPEADPAGPRSSGTTVPL